MTNDEIPELTEENTIIQVGMSVDAAKRLNSVLQEIVISGRTVRHGTHDVSDVSLSVMLALREYEKVK